MVGTSAYLALYLQGTLKLTPLDTGLGFVALSRIALDSASEGRAGASAGIVNTLRQIGASTGVAGFGALFPATINYHDSYTALSTVLAAGAFTAAVGAIIAALTYGASPHLGAGPDPRKVRPTRPLPPCAIGREPSGAIGVRLRVGPIQLNRMIRRA